MKLCLYSVSQRGDIANNNAEMGVLGYEILDLGKHTVIGYPDIRIHVDITSVRLFYFDAVFSKLFLWFTSARFYTGF